MPEPKSPTSAPASFWTVEVPQACCGDDPKDAEILRLRGLVDALSGTIGYAGAEIARLNGLVDGLCGTILVAAAR